MSTISAIARIVDIGVHAKYQELKTACAYQKPRRCPRHLTGFVSAANAMHDAAEAARKRSEGAPTPFAARGAIRRNSVIPMDGPRLVVPARSHDVRPMGNAIRGVIRVSGGGKSPFAQIPADARRTVLLLKRPLSGLQCPPLHPLLARHLVGRFLRRSLAEAAPNRINVLGIHTHSMKK